LAKKIIARKAAKPQRKKDCTDSKNIYKSLSALAPLREKKNVQTLRPINYFFQELKAFIFVENRNYGLL
jgi:hypothetical protein